MSIVYLTSDIILCSTIFYMREIIDINCFALPIPLSLGQLILVVQLLYNLELFGLCPFSVTDKTVFLNHRSWINK